MKRQTFSPVYSPNLHGEHLRAVLTPETAFIVGLPQMVAEPRIVQVALCPTRGDALVVQEHFPTPALVPGGGEPVPSELNLLLYQARRRRIVSLTTYRQAPGEASRLGKVFWWTGGSHAIVTLSRPGVTPADRAWIPLLLDIEKGTAKTLFPEPIRGSTPLHFPSPTKPLAVTHLLTPGESNTKAPFFLVTPDGKVTQGGQAGMIEGFLDDGETLLLSGDDSASSLFHLPTRKETALTPEQVEKLRPRLRPQDIAEADAKKELPLRLTLVQETVQGAPLSLLTLEATATRDSVLVQAGAEPAGITRDLSALLYFVQGQLYLAPLNTLPRPSFLALRDTQERELCLRRLSGLRNTLINYHSAHPDSWPTELAELFGTDERNLGLTQNPRTGKDDLRFEPLGSKHLASLGGPGGRAVLYDDGRIVWEPGR